MAKKLYVGNLPWGTKKDHLESVIASKIAEAMGADFSTEDGKANATSQIEDNFFKQDERGNARFSIVTIKEDEVALKVAELMNEMEFDANDGRGPRNLVVNEARPREDRPAGQGYGSRNRYSNSSGAGNRGNYRGGYNNRERNDSYNSDGFMN